MPSTHTCQHSTLKIYAGAVLYTHGQSSQIFEPNSASTNNRQWYCKQTIHNIFEGMMKAFWEVPLTFWERDSLFYSGSCCHMRTITPIALGWGHSSLLAMQVCVKPLNSSFVFCSCSLTHTAMGWPSWWCCWDSLREEEVSLQPGIGFSSIQSR